MPHMDPAEYNTRAKRLEIKKLLDNNILKVSGLVTPFPAPATTKPTEYIETVLKNLDFCHDLDIPKLRVDTVSPPTEIPGGMDYETSTHAPLGTGVINFDDVIPAILAAGYTDDWWPIDLCFWPNALEVTAENKKFLDNLIKKYGK